MAIILSLIVLFQISSSIKSFIKCLFIIVNSPASVLLEYIFEVYEKVPSLEGVINHIAKPYIKKSIFEPWAKEMQELSKINSLHCKISGMVEEMSETQGTDILEGYTDHVIDIFGVDKVMFGSNWPVCLIKKSYSEVLDIAKNISTNLDSEKFFYTNGKNFYLN